MFEALGESGNRKTQYLMIALLIVVILAASAVTVVRFFGGGGRAGRTRVARELKFECVKCGYQFEPDEKTVSSAEICDEMPALDCPQCEAKASCFQMLPCPKCGKYYLRQSVRRWALARGRQGSPASQPEAAADICPYCGTDSGKYLSEARR